MKRYLWSTSFHMGSALVLTLLTVAVWVLGVMDERDLMNDSVGRMDDAQRELRRTQRDLARLDQAWQKVQTNRKQISFLRERFLTRKDERVIAISKALDDLAKTYQIGLDEIRYASTSSQNKDLEFYRVDFPLQGRYRDIRDFVNDVERSDLQLLVTQIEVEDSGQYQGAVRARLSLATYFERNEP